MVDDLEVMEEFGEGNEHQKDHIFILFKMNLKPATILDIKESYNYNKTDFSAMIIFMRSVNWKDGLCGGNVDRSWHIIKNIVDQCRKHYVPKMGKIKKRKPSWVDNRAHKAQKIKHKSYDRQKREPSDENREYYKKALNIFTMEAIRSKEKFETKMAGKIKHDRKSLFSYTRSKSRTKHSVAPFTDRNGAITIDNCGKSLILNEFFSSVFTKENTNSSSHPEHVFTGDIKECLLDVDVLQSIVEKKLSK